MSSIDFVRDAIRSVENGEIAMIPHALGYTDEAFA